jgi:hypothetical protein
MGRVFGQVRFSLFCVFFLVLRFDRFLTRFVNAMRLSHAHLALGVATCVSGFVVREGMRLVYERGEEERNVLTTALQRRRTKRHPPCRGRLHRPESKASRRRASRGSSSRILKAM